MTGKSGSFGTDSNISLLYFVKFIACNVFHLSTLREICDFEYFRAVKLVPGLHNSISEKGFIELGNRLRRMPGHIDDQTLNLFP